MSLKILKPLILLGLLAVSGRAQPFCVLYRPPPYYIPLPTPEPTPIRGSVFNEAFRSGMATARPFIDAAHQQQEEARKQEEHDAEMAKIEAETKLLNEQAEYIRSKRERPDPHDLEWAEGVLNDSASSKAEHQNACRVYLEKKKFTGFDPDAFLCERGR